MKNSTKDLTLESLVDLSSINSLQLSANGKEVVYTTAPANKAGEHNVSQVHLAVVGKMHSSKPLTSGLFNDRAPIFSPKEAKIAFLSNRSKPGESEAIYLLPTDGPGEAVPITAVSNKKSINKIEWSPGGQFIAFVSSDEKTSEQERREKEKDDRVVYDEEWEYGRLRVVHVGTKEVRTLVSQDRHVSSFSWRNDGKALVYVTTRTPEIDSGVAEEIQFATFDLSTGKSSTLCHFNGMHQDVKSFCKDDIYYFASGITPGSICTSLNVWALDLNSEDPVPEQVIEQEDWSIDSIQKGTSKAVIAGIQVGMKTAIVHLDGDGIETIYSGLHGIDFVAAKSSDSLNVVLVKSDINTPPEIYSFTVSPSSRSVRPEFVQLSSHNTSVLPRTLGTTTTFSFTAPDGTPREGFLLSPKRPEKDASKASIPMLVHIHGGPYWRTTISFTDDARFGNAYLVYHGYAILSVNYRGGSGHGESYAAAARHQMGDKEYGDVMAVVRHALKNNPELDPKRVAVGGWSQGGFLSYVSTVRGVKAAAEEVLKQKGQFSESNSEDKDDPDAAPFHFRASICGAGVTDWDMMAMTSDAPTFECELMGTPPWESDKSSTSSRRGSPIWEMQGAVKAVEEALNSSKAMDGRPTIKKEDLMTPALMLHGERDERVPLTQAIAYRRGCQRHGWPFEMAVYPREPHGVRERNHVLDICKRVKKHLDTNLL